MATSSRPFTAADYVANMDKDQLATTFLNSYLQLFGRPKRQPDAPSGSFFAHQSIIIKILSKWHGAPRILNTHSFSHSILSGRVFAQALLRAAQNNNQQHLLGSVASFLNKMRAQIEATLAQVGQEEIAELEEFGPVSWIHCQRMDYHFFESARDTLKCYFAWYKSTIMMNAQAHYGRLHDGVPMRSSMDKIAGAGSNKATKRKLAEVEDGEKDDEPRSHGIGKKVKNRKTVALSGGMVGAPGSIKLKRTKNVGEGEKVPPHTTFKIPYPPVPSNTTEPVFSG